MLFALLAGDAVRYTISWYGFAALHLALLGVAVWLIARDENRPRLRNLPLTLLAFVVYCALTIVWSEYRLETLAATVIQVITAVGAGVGCGGAGSRRLSPIAPRACRRGPQPVALAPNTCCSSNGAATSSWA